MSEITVTLNLEHTVMYSRLKGTSQMCPEGAMFFILPKLNNVILASEFGYFIKSFSDTNSHRCEDSLLFLTFMSLATLTCARSSVQFFCALILKNIGAKLCTQQMENTFPTIIPVYMQPCILRLT